MAHFGKVSIHEVINIKADVTVCNEGTDARFECLQIQFIGSGDEAEEIEVYFKKPIRGRAAAFAAVINALTPQAIKTEAA